MKKVLSIGLLLLLIAGCSSKPSKPDELSPEKKRNNFDACVIEKRAIITKELEARGSRHLDSNQVRIMEEGLEELCVKFLK